MPEMQFRSALVALVFIACGGGSSAKPDAIADTFDRNALLAHLGENVLLPIHATFDTRANALPAAIAAHCDALDAGTPGTTLDTARAAWRDAMDTWERAEELLIGPAAMDNKALRDPDAFVRGSAVLGSAYLGWPQLAEPLRAVASEEEPDQSIRNDAATLVSRLGASAAKPA